jgi:hypothetical protein
MFTLKRITRDGIPRALEKAERYRLLNEPGDAESICLDILEVEPDNQRALVALLLARTDQFPSAHGPHIASAREVLPRLVSDYERAYYGGIICERWAKSLQTHGAPGTGPSMYGWLREAMECYELAERLHPPGRDEAVLRWNACARLIVRRPDLRPGAEDRAEVMLE